MATHGRTGGIPAYPPEWIAQHKARIAAHAARVAAEMQRLEDGTAEARDVRGRRVTERTCLVCGVAFRQPRWINGLWRATCERQCQNRLMVQRRRRA